MKPPWTNKNTWWQETKRRLAYVYYLLVTFSYEKYKLKKLKKQYSGRMFRVDSSMYLSVHHLSEYMNLIHRLTKFNYRIDVFVVVDIKEPMEVSRNSFETPCPFYAEVYNVTRNIKHIIPVSFIQTKCVSFIDTDDGSDTIST